VPEAEEAQALCACRIAAAGVERRRPRVALDFVHDVLAQDVDSRLSGVDAFTGVSGA
jgi:hypothetical protein